VALRHFICAVTLVVAAALPAASQSPTTAEATGTSKYLIFLRSTQIGTEEVGVSLDADGWTIRAAGRFGPPLDLSTKSLQLKYARDWTPLELTLDATTNGRAVGMHVTVAGTTATTHLNLGGQPTDRADTIAPGTMFLPNPFFASYEAISRRLASTQSGATIPVYQGAAPSVMIRVGDSQTEQIQTVGRLIDARRTHATLVAANVMEVSVEIWAEQSGRLLRVSIPDQGFEYVRDDVASVSSRRVAISRTGDEKVFVPANGFNLAGTLSKPATASGKRPAIVLVAGSGGLDRDEAVAGIPIFGQLAGQLADAGFVVLRYDKRGIGQSGGRVESAGIPDYADDLRFAVKYLASRKDVDSKRIVVAGHSEGGEIALLEAAKDGRVAALVLMGTPGIVGSEVVLAQQRHLLERSTLSESDKLARIDLQKRIHDAVMSGKGWDAVPPELRRQADNPEFQSILAFDPAKVVPQVHQPILIVQGLLDTQVEPANADRLETLARSRKRQASVDVVKISGVNHLFVPATTGEVSEYGTLKEKQISADLAPTIARWVDKVLASGR
jgi:pimeloyl-ACP methyl ester carboxylesterase